MPKSPEQLVAACEKARLEGKDFPTQEYPTAFDLATGIEVGDGGAYLGDAPYLYFLRDAKGTGKADTHDILLSGFGSQDTHETLNTLQWGPDGQLYGLHGIFTQTKVGKVEMDAAVWRYDARCRRFGIFAEGTSNPSGLDFDPARYALVSSVDRDAWTRELALHDELFCQLEHRLPAELPEVRRRIAARLAD